MNTWIRLTKFSEHGGSQALIRAADIHYLEASRLYEDIGGKVGTLIWLYEEYRGKINKIGFGVKESIEEIEVILNT